MLELHQVLPRHPPGPGTGEPPVREAQEPLRMVLLEDRTPARVVDADVQQYPSAPEMHGVSQFAELVEPRGAPVKNHQCRVNGRQVQGCVWAAEAAKPRVRGGGGIDREQMQYPAAELIHDMRQKRDKVAELARGRNHGVAGLIQLGQAALELRVARAEGGPGLAEHPRKGAVEGVGGSAAIRMHGDTHVRSRRPMLPAPGVHQIGLGPEKTHLCQGQLEGPGPLLFVHR